MTFDHTDETAPTGHSIKPLNLFPREQPNPGEGREWYQHFVEAMSAAGFLPLLQDQTPTALTDIMDEPDAEAARLKKGSEANSEYVNSIIDRESDRAFAYIRAALRPKAPRLLMSIESTCKRRESMNIKLVADTLKSVCIDKAQFEVRQARVRAYVRKPKPMPIEVPNNAVARSYYRAAP